MKKDNRTFEQLVDDMTQIVHSRLLISGGKGLRSGVFTAMQQAITWQEDNKK
jgi:hypothetical protein